MSLYKHLKKFEERLRFKNEIKWFNVLFIGGYHILGLFWCYRYAFPVKWQTVVYAGVVYFVSGFGITGGVHRLWTHKSYKANLLLKLMALAAFSTAGLNSIYHWVRDHRVHHKFSDTDADPHNANRGLFFSHIGWLLMKKNDEVIKRGKQIDMSDIANDPLLRFHTRYFPFFSLTFCYILPTMVGIWLWDENWQCSVAWQCFIRYLSVLHATLTVNSFAHHYGYKPYNENIRPTQNIFVSTVSFGEGWHNYHHLFPFDYKAEENFFSVLNFTTTAIHIFNKLGWAYDLRQATPQMVNSVTQRLGRKT